MSMTSREQFEQGIKARFGDSIDYRICKNSDGEYMAWDMQVAWWAWQAASKASEQQLAAVVAENAGLKQAAEFATATDMWEELGGDVLRYQYKDWYVDKLKAAMKIPATDAYLVEALEKAQRANAAQDNHINQQQDRIDTLEKTNAGLGKRVTELTEFLSHIKKCLLKNDEYAPLSHEEIDTLLGIRVDGKGEER